MPKPTPTGSDNTAHLISAVRRAVNAFLVARLEQTGVNGFSPSHGDIIATLLRTGPITMSELARRINRDPSTVTTLVRKLRANGYVGIERSQTDTRQRVVVLTDEGRGLESSFVSISQELADVMWRGVDPDQRAVTRRVLQRILDNVSCVDSTEEADCEQA